MGMSMFAQRTRKPRQDDADFAAPLRRGDAMHANARAFARGTPEARSSSDRGGIPRFAQARVGVGPKPTMRDTSGLKPAFDPDQVDDDVGGATLGESVGDVTRPVGSFLGNVFGSVVGGLTGTNISTTTTTPAAWKDHGQFAWEVAFATSGTNGWIVQEVESTRRAQDAVGNSLPDPLTLDYWEAWAVDGAGKVTPGSGATNDTWGRRSWGTNTQGHWSMTGSVYFTTVDPATQGFTPGGVPEAGILLSTTTEPSGLGIARLHRYAQGTWDSTGAAPTHTGSAGP
jgi:hypothetical protein